MFFGFGKLHRVVRAVKNVSLELFQGETLGIVGESGVGKTTFVNLLLGLLKPSGGKILLDQKEITNNYITICFKFN